MRKKSRESRLITASAERFFSRMWDSSTQPVDVRISPLRNHERIALREREGCGFLISNERPVLTTDSSDGHRSETLYCRI
jgi:hypothetical protein